MATIKGNRALIQRKSVPSPFDLAGFFKDHSELNKLGEEYKKSIAALLERLQISADSYEQMSVEHEKLIRHTLQEIRQAIADVSNEAAAHIRSIVPEKGKDAPAIDEKALAERVFGMVRVPKDGESLDEDSVVGKILSALPSPEKIDHKKIAKEVMKLFPKQEKAKEAPTLDEILNAIKENIKVEHIPGLKNEIDSYRRQLAGKKYGVDTWARGGGDIVAAGTGVTITTSNGQKIINAQAGLSVLSATGSIDNSNVVFTFTKQPTLVVVNGTSYRNGHGVAISGTTATLDNPVGTNGDIYGLG